MDIARLRNIGIAAHIDAGKTTVSERILFVSGVEHRIGEVDSGTAVMDWMPEERERGITITAAATQLPWRGHAINLVDTPGHVDFTVEVERCLRVLDGAVLVIDAVAGVQAQSEAVWRQMQRHRVPVLAFVNKCDRPGADFLAATASLQRRLGAVAVPVQYPLMEAGAVGGIIDLLRGVALRFSQAPAGGPGNVSEEPIPAAVADEAGVLRAELLERLAEEDEGLLQALLEGREPALAELKPVLRRRILAGSFVPVLCGAALRNIGIEPLLDAVVDYLPAPSERPPAKGRDADGQVVLVPCDPAAPLAALAFKLHADAHGDLTFVRLYAGSVRPGDQILNPRAGRSERVARVVRMHADARLPLESAAAGEIVALTGLKWTGTGDTLCSQERVVHLERLQFPEPVISMVLEPRSTGDREKLRLALRRMAHEDPTFHAAEDEATGQWLISGMGELHLEVALHRLAQEHLVEAAMGAPRVSYREAVRTGASAEARVDRVLGGKPVFGAARVEVEPLEALPGEGAPAGVEALFEPDCKIPAPMRPAVAEALSVAARVGPRLGFPLVQARVRVGGGDSKPGQDAEMAFCQAACIALRQALESARVDLLEPLMAFEIQTPPEFVSGIIADLNARHADVQGIEVEGSGRTLRGQVPLAQMFGYSTSVRSLSQGRASFTMLPAGYRVVGEDELAGRGLTWG